ncbi:Nuclear pore complex nucleoporin component [Coemansia aciculifera]|uniref:Nuclear pore complex nucleoporin component n=1 Tax=Coemansia aciculifera TaxID=417176 RepID=A0ACC1M5C7_9FUNG|nr:Nuclear pore complex nucleoporin component [Coemansia aciculifera]
MRYGLFASTSPGDKARLRAATVAEPPNCEALTSDTRNGLYTNVDVSPLFDRSRRTTSTKDHAPVVANAKSPSSRAAKPAANQWQVYSRCSLGVPLTLPVSTTSAASSAYSRVDRYRDLAEKTRVKLRRVSVDGVASARSQASHTYAQRIQHELEETQKFLAQLSLTTPTSLASYKPGSAAIDASVADTLNQVKELRKEYDEKRRAEEEAQAQQRRDKELEKQKEIQRKADEEKAKAAPPPAAAAPKPAATVTEVAKTGKAKPVVTSSSTSSSNTVVASPPLAVPTTVPTPIETKFVSDDALAWATKYRNMYAQLMSGLAPSIKNDKAKRMYCFNQRGTITKSIGQLKDSWVFVNRCTRTISDILAESKRQGADVHGWMLNLTAKAIVKQAEKEASIAQHAVYPLATTAVLLMQTYPQLADMLMIRLVKKCPYVIPQYFGRQPGQSVEDYLRSIGYKGKEDDELESESIYTERMAGMVALYAAIVQIPSANGKPNPFPVSYGWTWMARVLNLAPRSISPLLVHTFLSVAGTSLMAAYGKQFKKLLDTLSNSWIPSITAKDPTATASKSNLCGYLEKYQRTGVLPECEGRVIKSS